MTEPELTLFDVDRSASSLLRNRYLEPPFSVLDRRAGAWIARDRAWASLGIRSELGRGDGLAYNMTFQFLHSHETTDTPATSVFSPTLCELVYRWYSRAGDAVLDPFAGGSVRGVVASAMSRHYDGIELRPEQVSANRAQERIGGGPTPHWYEGDARNIGTLVPPGARYDLIFSCPPYAHLERYSDDPRDLSTLPYSEFRWHYRQIIHDTVTLLRPDRFVAWMVSEVREQNGHPYVGLVYDTVKAFRDCGLTLHNDHVVLSPVGTAAARTPAQFDRSRKAGRVHDYLLVFVKGDARAAAAWCNQGAELPTQEAA